MFTSCPETYQQLTKKKKKAVYIEENLLFFGRRLVALDSGVLYHVWRYMERFVCIFSWATNL